MNNIFPQLFDLIIIYIGKVKYLKTIYPFDDLIKQNQKLQTGHSNYSNFCQGIVALAVLDHLTMAFFTIGIEWRKCQCCNQPFKFKLILEKVFILSLCLENLSEFLILFFPATILEAYKKSFSYNLCFQNSSPDLLVHQKSVSSSNLP